MRADLSPQSPCVEPLMITIHCQQGSAEWHAMRLGIPTASQFSRILTPKTRKLASGSESYLHELLAEWLTGMPSGPESRGYLERGSDMEDWALSYYRLQTGLEVEKVGVCTSDDGMIGCSPDALVGADGGLEIKCPSAVQHVANLLDGVERYALQAQGGMWITGRKWWDILSYHPEIPAHILRVERDEELIGALAGAVTLFVDQLVGARQRLITMGCTPAECLDEAFAGSLLATVGQ